MSIVQRDYLMRIIEQSTRAFAEIAALILAGEFDLALIVVRKTSDLLLGDLEPVFERLEAASVVDLFGKLDLDRVRIYAALLAEEGAIRERSGQMPRARNCFSRALDLYEAISRSGAQLRTADWERISMLRPKLEAVNGQSEMDNRPDTGVNHMEPLARAFSRSVAERPADGGLFGPQSIVAFESQPGVMEARQRMELRMRE